LSDEEEKLPWWQILLGALLSAPIVMPIVFVVAPALPALQGLGDYHLMEMVCHARVQLAPLPFGYGCGLLLIFYCLTASGIRPKGKYTKEEAVSEFVWWSIIGPTASLAAGWIVKAILLP
jgi:cytochrome bd-type quinol oxidase subunit 1